ncbi:MAG: pyrophosphohydrolase [Proteobacteria bacterium]|nr:pyrophosphohydrolase [Pseudomonadota bacterium]
MPELPARPVLADFQRYVTALEAERGFASQTPVDKCLLLGEEIGELFRAVREKEGIAIDPNAKVGAIADELADVFIFVCSLANRYGIDLEEAFRTKEVTNKTRTWVSR